MKVELIENKSNVNKKFASWLYEKEYTSVEDIANTIKQNEMFEKVKIMFFQSTNRLEVTGKYGYILNLQIVE